VSKIRSSAFCHLRLIARTKKYTSHSTRLLLVHSYVISHVNFCTSTLCGINSSLITKLQAIFNSAMRLVYSVKKTESITSRLSEHQWLSVEKHIELRTLLFLISILQSLYIFTSNLYGTFLLDNFALKDQRPYPYREQRELSVIEHSRFSLLNYGMHCRHNSKKKYLSRQT